MKTTLTLLTALLLTPLAALHPADVLPASLARDSGPGANLLQNPSFEKKAGDGVEGWTSRAWAGKEATRWSVETPGRTGERCVSIASDRGGDAAWTAMVSVQPGACYRLSGWIKTREVRGAVGALLNIQNMQDVWTRAVSGTRDRTRVATVFQAEAAGLEINCLFGGWGLSTGQAWHDDLVVEPVAEPPDEPRAAVTIDTGAPSVPYSRMIFGGFPVACTVRMRERLLEGEYAALVLAGDSPEAFNDLGNPNRVAPKKTTGMCFRLSHTRAKLC